MLRELKTCNEKAVGLDDHEQLRSRCLDTLKRCFWNCQVFLNSWDQSSNLDVNFNLDKNMLRWIEPGAFLPWKPYEPWQSRSSSLNTLKRYFKIVEYFSTIKKFKFRPWFKSWTKSVEINQGMGSYYYESLWDSTVISACFFWNFWVLQILPNLTLPNLT